MLHLKWKCNYQDRYVSAYIKCFLSWLFLIFTWRHGRHIECQWQQFTGFFSLSSNMAAGECLNWLNAIGFQQISKHSVTFEEGANGTESLRNKSQELSKPIAFLVKFLEFLVEVKALFVFELRRPPSKVPHFESLMISWGRPGGTKQLTLV